MAAVLLTASSAMAASRVELVATGPTGGNGSFYQDPNSVRLSDDGESVLFSTQERLTADDTDSSWDVYVHSHGKTELVSTGPVGGNGAFDAYPLSISADGRRAYFITRERLTPDDADNGSDVYERSSGSTRLLSPDPVAGSASGVTLAGVSKDGARVFLQTTESLTSDDTNDNTDFYLRTGDSLVRISKGVAEDRPSNATSFALAVTPDGRHFVFLTYDLLTPGSTTMYPDIYDWSGGQVRLVSTGPDAGAPTDAGPNFVGISDDGRHILFNTDRSLVATDTNGNRDVYDRVDGTSTVLVSRGPDGHAVGGSAVALSRDGSRVLFVTRSGLVAADQDGGCCDDIYERAGEAVSLVSTGTGDERRNFRYLGSSADGSHVFFTDDSLNGTWERFNGTTTRLPIDGPFAGVSADGARVFLLGPGTEPFTYDFFQLYRGQSTRISTGPSGSSVTVCQIVPHVFSCPLRFNPAGTAAVFYVPGRLVPEDTDNSNDLYLWHADNPPDCAGAKATPPTIWPPNHKPVRVTIEVADPDGDAVSVDPAAVSVRADRGRTSAIPFTADDGAGGTCQGSVTVTVAHRSARP